MVGCNTQQCMHDGEHPADPYAVSNKKQIGMLGKAELLSSTAYAAD